MSRVSAVAASFTALSLAVASASSAWPASPDPGPRGQKSDFGIPSTPDPGPRGLKSDYGLPSTPDPGPRGLQSDDLGMGEGKEDYEDPDVAARPDPTMPSGALEREDVTRNLTVDAARRAIDAFAEVRDKYTDDGVENFSSLEEFVAETEAGKRLEADIVAFGFADISDWNETIVAVGFAYSAFVYDYAADLRQQIKAVRHDAEIDEEMRAQLIAGLEALMPSRNNREVMQALFADQEYRDKLRLLEEEE